MASKKAPTPGLPNGCFAIGLIAAGLLAVALQLYARAVSTTPPETRRREETRQQLHRVAVAHLRGASETELDCPTLDSLVEDGLLVPDDLIDSYGHTVRVECHPYEIAFRSSGEDGAFDSDDDTVVYQSAY